MEKKQIATYFLIVLLIVLVIGTIAFQVGGGVKSKPVVDITSTSTTTPTLTSEEEIVLNKFLTSTSSEWKNPRETYIRQIENNIYQQVRGFVEYETLIKIVDMSQKSAGNVAQIPFEFQGKKWQLNCGLIDLSQPAPQPQATTTEK